MTNKPNVKYLIVFAVVLIFIGIGWFLSSGGAMSVPDSLEVPLYNKIGKINVVSENGTQNIVFVSKSPTGEILGFYKQWAKENNFVFAGDSENNAFSLLPGMGSGHLDYHLSLETKENNTKVAIIYSEILSVPSPDDAEKRDIPNDLRIRF